MFSGNGPGTVQISRQPLVQNLVDERTLSGPGHSGYTRHDSKRYLYIDILQVILSRPFDLQPSRRLGPSVRDRDRQPAAQIRAGDRIFLLHNLFCRALGHDRPAVFSGARSDIHDIVRFAHRVLIMFDHDDRISQVSQMLQRMQQLVIIPLVKPYARFIEYIRHADKTGADLGGQTDTLSLSA